MSRRTRERRLEAEERWPELCRFLGGYLHEDWPEMYGSISNAVDVGVREWHLAGRQAVLREWRDWNSSVGWTNEVVAFLQDGIGVNVHFNSDVEARQLMNAVYDKLIVSVRRETSREWKP